MCSSSELQLTEVLSSSLFWWVYPYLSIRHLIQIKFPFPPHYNYFPFHHRAMHKFAHQPLDKCPCLLCSGTEFMFLCTFVRLPEDTTVIIPHLSQCAVSVITDSLSMCFFAPDKLKKETSVNVTLLIQFGRSSLCWFWEASSQSPALLNCCMHKQNLQYEVTTVHFSCIWNFRLCLPNTTYLSGAY